DPLRRHRDRGRAGALDVVLDILLDQTGPQGIGSRSAKAHIADDRLLLARPQRAVQPPAPGVVARRPYARISVPGIPAGHAQCDAKTVALLRKRGVVPGCIAVEALILVVDIAILQATQAAAGRKIDVGLLAVDRRAATVLDCEGDFEQL